MKKKTVLISGCVLFVLFLTLADHAAGQVAKLDYPVQRKQAPLFVGTSVGGTADNYYYADPRSFSLINSGGNTYTDNVTGAVFSDPFGRDIFVSCGYSGEISRGRLTGNTVTWETVIAFTAGPTIPDGAYGIDYDRKNDVIWTLANPGTGERELIAVDVDKKSPTYGQVLGYTNGVSAIGWTEKWALNPAGTIAAVPECVAQSFTPELILWNTDPTSPKYLQIVENLIVPVRSGGIPFVLIPDVEFTADGKELLVLVQTLGGAGEIARFSFTLGKWIDHDPSTPSVVDNIGSWSVPPIPIGSSPTSLDASPVGSFFAVSGIDGAGWAGRLDLDPQNPMVFSWTWATGTYLPNAWECCVYDRGRGVAVNSWSPPELKLFDAATMTYKGSIALPGASNIYTVVPSR